MARIFMATIGSLGDLYPLLSIATELRARGHDILFAVHGGQTEIVRAAGFAVTPHLGDIEDLAAHLGLPETEVVRRLFSRPQYLFQKVLPFRLEEVVRMFTEVAGDVDLVVAPFQSEDARMLAEIKGAPSVTLKLQPMTVFDATQPALIPGMGALIRRPGKLGTLWNRAMFWAGFKVMKLMHGHRVAPARRALGLPKHPRAPWFQQAVKPALTLGTYPVALHHHAPVLDPPHICTGFCPYDGAEAGLDAELEAFLAAGAPPIVFTLGSNAQYLKGDFYGESVKAARALGRRAVILTGEGWAPEDHEGLDGPDVIQRDYLPHQRIFPRAAAIVHHGGIGTWARAMEAAKPSLVVPFGTDQPDNARRNEEMGLGLTLPASRYTARRAEALLSKLLEEPDYREAAAKMAASLAAEDGPRRAAEALETVLARTQIRGAG